MSAKKAECIVCGEKIYTTSLRERLYMDLEVKDLVVTHITKGLCSKPCQSTYRLDNQ